MIVATLGLMLTPIKMSGWVVAWNRDSVAQLELSGHMVSDALIECIKVRSDGTVEVRDTYGLIEARVKAAAKKHKFALYAMASNFDGEFDSKRMDLVFGNAEVAEKHIAGLIKIAQEHGFQGIDLDYESMKASARAGYSEFAKMLSTRLHAANLKLSITVHPKESEPGNWDGPRSQDWKALGEASDSFRLMCYDNHWSTGDPGPIAPDAWVESVCQFAKTVVSASKLSIGVAGYGYDWNKKPADSLTWLSWAERYKTKPKTDPASGELIYPKAYFAGTASILRKVAIAKKLGIPSVSLWYIGSEEPSLWTEFGKIR